LLDWAWSRNLAHLKLIVTIGNVMTRVVQVYN
jgi:hypothetical protein